MRTEYIVYRPGAPPLRKWTVLDPEPAYLAIAAIVQPYLGAGRPIERVRVIKPGSETKRELAESDAVDMFVDEMGLMIGLPPNPEATRIYRANWLRRNPGADPDSLSHIAGPAVLFLRQVWF
jgi:hypothetical protein